MVNLIESEDGWKELMEHSKEKLVVVGFSASWCGPCQLMKPHFELISKEHPTAIFASLDVDKLSSLAQRCDIRALPTFQFFDNGEKADEFVGNVVEGLKAKVADMLARHEETTKIKKVMKSIESEGEWHDVMEQSKEKYVVVNFCALWSSPCQTIVPLYEAMAKELSTAMFAYVDVDVMSDLAEKFGIIVMPTIQIFKDGVKVDEFTGGDPDGIELKVKEWVSKRALMKKATAIRGLRAYKE